MMMSFLTSTRHNAGHGELNQRGDDWFENMLISNVYLTESFACTYCMQQLSQEAFTIWVTGPALKWKTRINACELKWFEIVYLPVLTVDFSGRPFTFIRKVRPILFFGPSTFGFKDTNFADRNF